MWRLGMGDTTYFVFNMIPILLKASIVNIDTDIDTDTILLNWTFKLSNVLYYWIPKCEMGNITHFTLYLKHILTFSTP